MKSKTSCFNKTIFKKNMTHFWPLWALYSCYLIVSLPVGLWFNMRYYLQDDSYSQLQRQVYAISGAMRAAMNPVITFAFAAVMIMAVFSYLYSAKNTNMIHSLPVDRRELFVTNIISASAFMIVPQILTFIITVFVCIGAHITNIQYILYWFGAEAAMTFFALALGAFVAMFTGQLMAFPVYYVVVNYLYVGCWYLINMVIESVCFGVSNNWNPGKSCILSPIYYLTNNLRIQSVENSEYVTVGIEFKGAYLLGIYAVAGVVFLIAAYQLYKWRKLETAGDLISMRGIKPVFRWGVAGAALATVLAQLVSTIGCFIYAFVRYPVLRLHREDWRITMMDVKRHLTRGIPLGLQFSVLAVGIIVMQGGVVQFDMRDGVMVSNAAQNGFGAANRLFNLVATPMNALGGAMTSFTAQNLGAGQYDRIRRGTLQALGMVSILAILAAGTGLLLTRGDFCYHVFLSADKVTPDAVRYGNSLLYVDFSMYLFLGFVFVVRNCVQGIGRSGFVLGAGAAELVARITVCLVLPGLFAGGAVSADAPAMAFYALCAADPMAWIAADTVLCIPFFRNILKKNYGYLRSGRA